MPLLGSAAMTSWHNLAPGSETGHDHWHSHQHLAERVGIPGFRRGRRHLAVRGGPAYFLMYEVDDLGVLTSEPYQTRLNAPTEWSQQIIPSIHDMNRTLCRVLGSAGEGVGTFVVTVRFTADERRESLIGGIVDKLLASLVQQPGIVAAHLLAGDAAASGVPTRESRLRGGGGDQFADLVLIVEAYDLPALDELASGALSDASLASRGASGDTLQAIYQLAHVYSETDLPHR